MRLFILIFLVPLSSFPQGIKPREYKTGAETVYKLTSESYNNDKFSGKSISVAKLTVVQDSTMLSEEIKWISKTSFSDKDTINKDKAAQSIEPYKISLLPNGKVLLPKLSNPEMVGDITDLNTFFVAVSPALNIQKLNSKSPVFKNEKITPGDFADGVRILKGSDCTEVTQTLVKRTKKYTIVKTEFLPPFTNCLVPLLDTIAKKTFEYPNNFQMVQHAQEGKVNLIWGNESFTIITRIDNSYGKILDATMTNVLNLRMRINASPDLQTYAVEIPYKISRNLKLELLK